MQSVPENIYLKTCPTIFHGAQNASPSTLHSLQGVLKVSSCSSPGRWQMSFFLLFVQCVLNHFSHVQLFATPWTVAHQAPLFMGFSRHEYWSRLPFPPPGDLPHLGTELTSLMSPALTGRFSTTSATCCCSVAAKCSWQVPVCS